MPKNNRKLREEHAAMEDARSSSYAIFADSDIYATSYDAYIKTFEDFSKRQDTVNVLVIGAATGVMENIGMNKFDNLKFVSIDNSLDFREMYLKKNKKFIDEGRACHISDKIQNFKSDEKFDIIICRDVNHHLEQEDVEGYISLCYPMLKTGGVFIIEDLKREAEKDGVLDLTKIVYEIPGFREDDYNRRHKIIGILDSYLCAYYTTEIEGIIKKLKIPYTLENGKYRYKFTMTK